MTISEGTDSAQGSAPSTRQERAGLAGWCQDARVSDRQPYTIAADASEPEREAVCRASLRVIWPDLLWLDIDMAALPGDAQTDAAAAALQPYRTKSLLSRRLTETAHVVPGRDDAALDAVLHLAGKTIGSTGLAASDARMVYDANDRGTSCVFDLTNDQRDEVLQALRDQRMREQLLISWRG